MINLPEVEAKIREEVSDSNYALNLPVFFLGLSCIFHQLSSAYVFLHMNLYSQIRWQYNNWIKTFIFSKFLAGSSEQIQL